MPSPIGSTSNGPGGFTPLPPQLPPGPPPPFVERSEWPHGFGAVRLSWHVLSEEARTTPYRMFLRPVRGNSIRAMTASWLGGIGWPAVAIAVALLALQEMPGPWILSSLLLRLGAIALTAQSVTWFARRDLGARTIESLALTRLAPRDLVLGWALAGWVRTAPCALAAPILFVPLAELAHPALLLLAPLELAQWVALQGVAALTAANMSLIFHLRRWAGLGGWISGAVTTPVVALAQAALLTLPLHGLFFIGLAGNYTNFTRPGGASRLSEAWIAYGWLMGFMFAVAYFVWVPLVAARAIGRQIELAERHGPDLLPYLESKR